MNFVFLFCFLSKSNAFSVSVSKVAMINKVDEKICFVLPKIALLLCVFVFIFSELFLFLGLCVSV